MSIRVMDRVFQCYPGGGGEMLLALALADHADDDGENIFPSVEKLATKTRQAERTVQYQLRRMEAAGWLLRVNRGNGGRSQTTEYRISPLWLKGADFAPIEKGANDSEKGANDDTKGCNPRQKRVQQVAPAYNRHRTVKEPSVIVSSASAQKRDAVRAAALPSDFAPDATAVQMAAELGVVLGDELAAFADYHAANGSRYKDWQAALRTWLRNAARFAARGAPAGGRRAAAAAPAKSFAQQEREAGWARWEAMTGRVHPDRVAAQAAGALAPVAGVIDVACTPAAAGLLGVAP